MRENILKLLGVLSAAYPRFALSEETAELYCKMLADIDNLCLQITVKNHILTGKYFPTIAELRGKAENVNIRLSWPYNKFLDGGGHDQVGVGEEINNQELGGVKYG